MYWIMEGGVISYKKELNLYGNTRNKIYILFKIYSIKSLINKANEYIFKVY